MNLASRCTHLCRRRLRRGRVGYVLVFAFALTMGVMAMSLGLHQRQVNEHVAADVAALGGGATVDQQVPQAPPSATAAVPRLLDPPLARPIASEHFVRYVPSENHTRPLLWTPAPQTRRPTPAWANTAALVAEVETLEQQLPREAWPSYVLDALYRMHSFDPAQEEDAVAELLMLAQPSSLPEEIDDPRLRSDLQTTCAALRRRVVIWQQLQRIAAAGPNLRSDPDVNPYAMWVQIQEAIDAIPYPQSQAWRRYLQMDDLENLLRREPTSRDELARLARLVLEQLHSPRLSARQRQLLRCPEVEHLDVMLRRCATRPADIAAVVNAMEHFEETGSQKAAGQLSRLAFEMRWSADPRVAELARRIDQLYRGANLRVSITGDLLNRLLSEPLVATEPLQYQGGAAPMVGEQKTSTDLSLRLLPAQDQWRLQLMADGTVTVDTTVFAGAATFFVAGSGSFQSSKLLVFDRDQIDLSPAEATGDFDLQLGGVQTSMDALPLIRRVVRDTAVSRFQQHQFAARRRLRSEVRDQARQTLDRDTQAYLGDAQARLEARALRPLRSLGLPLVPLQLQTTDRHIVGDYRLAGSHQTGAHAPPPAAPEGSLASVQVHQSAINNVLQRLALDGRAAKLQTLCRDLFASIGLPDAELIDGVPEAIALRFADEQPLQVDLRDGEAHLVVRLAHFSIAEKQWRDVTVRCAYRIDQDARVPVLRRCGEVDVECRQLGIMDRIVLDGIFARLLQRADRIPIVPEVLAAHPGLSDVVVTQSHVDDGWLALAWRAKAEHF